MTKQEALNKAAGESINGATVDMIIESVIRGSDPVSGIHDIIHRAMDIYAGGWISVEERLPEIDEDKDWNKLNKISKDVLAYSKIWGMRFGRYFHHADFWTVDNTSSSNGIKVEYWKEITPPNEP